MLASTAAPYKSRALATIAASASLSKAASFCLTYFTAPHVESAQHDSRYKKNKTAISVCYGDVRQSHVVCSPSDNADCEQNACGGLSLMPVRDAADAAVGRTFAVVCCLEPAGC